MSEQIEPGDGWRLLGPDEPVDGFGDEYGRLDGVWFKVPSYFTLRKASEFHAVRRRIPAKPEAMEIDDELTIKTGDITDQPCLLHREEDKPYWICFEPHGCRKLADWLTRFADWREAQEATGNGRNQESN